MDFSYDSSSLFSHVLEKYGCFEHTEAYKSTGEIIDFAAVVVWKVSLDALLLFPAVKTYNLNKFYLTTAAILLNKGATNIHLSSLQETPVLYSEL